MFEERIDPNEVQYLGIPGMPPQCLSAVDTVVNSEVPPRKASLVLWQKDRQSNQEEYLFLFWDWNSVPLTVVHSGFATGYSGDGPKRFSQALCMIWDRAISINMVIVNEAVFNAIESRRLTRRIIDELKNGDDRPLTWPWNEWMYSEDIKHVEDHTFWLEFHRSKLNADFLDPVFSITCHPDEK